MSEKNLPLNSDELQLSLFPDQMSEEEKSRIELEVAAEQERIDKVINERKEKPSRKPLDISVSIRS